MTGRDVPRREKALSLLLSILMIGSVMGIGVGALAGSAVAHNKIPGADIPDYSTEYDRTSVDAVVGNKTNNDVGYDSIQAALDSVGADSIVLVTENYSYTNDTKISISKNNVTLVSESGPTVTSIENDENSALVFTGSQTQSNVTVKGFNITSKHGQGIFSNARLENLRLESNIISGSNTERMNAVQLNGGIDGGTFVENKFSNSTSAGMNLNYGKNIVVKNNVINSVRRGIFTYNLENVTIAANTIEHIRAEDGPGKGAPVAIPVAGNVSNITIEHNVIDKSEFGVVTYDYSGGSSEKNEDITIRNNTFANNSVQVYDGFSKDSALNLEDVDENNEFDVVATDTAETTAPVISATIQGAVDLAENGGTVNIAPGTYIEEVEIDKPLTLESEGTAAETTIRLTQEEASSTGAPTVDILSPGVTVDGFTVQRNSTDENVAQGIRVSNGSESGDTVVVSNNIVENLNTTRSVDNGILVGDNNDDDTPANVIVRSNTVSEFPNGIGVTSKTSDEVVRNVTIRNNTLYDNGVGLGVSNVSGAGVESIEATQNNITQNSVGVYLFGNEDAGRLSFTDVNASEVSVNTNNIIDNTGEVPDPEGGVMSVPSSIVNNGANELDATLNYYGKSTTPNTSSAVRYDPVLTTSIENISADSTSDIRQYGSYLEISSDDGSPIAVGFAAPPDGNASEVLGDVVDVPSTVYRYDNTADKFVSINGSYTPSTGEVLVIAPEETLNEETIIPIATDSETAASPDSVDLTQGWNLVATGATNDPSGIAVADGGADGVINDASLQVQPAQPGAPSANTGAFEGTWLFVDADGQLFTGYTEDQSPSTYSEEVLEPDTDKTE